jgi:hypothetical protein
MSDGPSPAAFHAVADDGTREIAACSFMELIMRQSAAVCACVGFSDKMSIH